MGKIGRNLTFLLVSQLATWSITLVVLVIVPARLGEADFGKFGFATAFVQYFVLAASLGTATLLIKVVARDPSLLPRYVYNAVILKVVLGTVLGVLAVALAWAIGTRGDKLTLVAVGCVGMMFAVLSEVFVGAQAGLEVMGRPALWGVLQTYVASVIGLIFVLNGAGVVWYGVAFMLSPIVNLIGNGRKVWPWLAGQRTIDLGIWWILVRDGLPLMAIYALNLFYGTIDIPMLDFVAGDAGNANVGWYTLAYRFVAIPVFIATAAVTAFFPSFSAYGTSSRRAFIDQVNRALRLVVVVSIPAAAGLAAVAEDLVALLYRDQYQGSIAPMQILALHIPLACLGMVLGMSLIASDRHHRYLWVAGFAALVAPFIGYVAIRWGLEKYGNGAIGASVSTLLIELTVMAGALKLRVPGVYDRATWWFTGRTLVATAAMAGVVALVHLPLLARVAIGVIAYGLALLAVRVVYPRDLATVVQQCRSVTERPAAAAAIEPNDDDT